jgi:glycosyltransferase involved in cell wall biosynthesis
VTAKKILFISYNAQRSGAAILLLNLAKAVKEVAGYDLDFLFRHGGELIYDFKALGNVKCINASSPGIKEKILNRIVDRTEAAVKSMLSKHYDNIIVNTVLNADILPVISHYYKGRIISYIHELKVAIEALTSGQSLSSLIKHTNLFIVPSTSIKKLFIDTYKVDKKKVHVLPSYIPLTIDKSSTAGIHKQFTVGACGAVEMRKGTDLFVQLVNTFNKKYPGISIEFLWLGGNSHSLEFKLLSEDIQKLHLHNIKLMPAQKNVEAFYNSLDVFVLTSREDPYPLVVLEAADAAVPCICFDKAGDATEFVNGNGKVVNYLDLEEMAASIYEYYLHPGLRSTDGNQAKAKLAVLHQNKKEIVQQFLSIIE